MSLRAGAGQRQLRDTSHSADQADHEREQIGEALTKISNNVEDIPIVIGDEQITTPDVRYQVMVRRKKKWILHLDYSSVVSNNYLVVVVISALLFLILAP